jgi:hypothetical protein
MLKVEKFLYFFELEKGCLLISCCFPLMLGILSFNIFDSLKTKVSERTALNESEEDGEERLIENMVVGRES